MVAGARVDVLVTRDGRGTRLALQDVEVRRGAGPPAGTRPTAERAAGTRVAATLRTTVRQAVYLTAAQSFAREIRLLPRAPGTAAPAPGGGARMSAIRSTSWPTACARRWSRRPPPRRRSRPPSASPPWWSARPALLDAATRAELTRRVTERALGLGPLQPLLEDPTVDEVLVSGLSPVWVERGGRLEETGVAFTSEVNIPVGKRFLIWTSFSSKPLLISKGLPTDFLAIPILTALWPL